MGLPDIRTRTILLLGVIQVIILTLLLVLFQQLADEPAPPHSFFSKKTAFSSFVDSGILRW